MMQKEKYSIENFLRISFLLITILLVIYIFYIRWEPAKLLDLSFYIDSGKSFLSGRNPYSSPDLYQSKWGAFGAIVLYLMFGWYPIPIATSILLLLNFLGILLFIKHFCSGNYLQLSFFLTFILISSVNRENLVNGQITGLILLSLSLSIRLLERQVLSIPAIFLLGFSIEMKPQVSIPLLLYIFSRKAFPLKLLLYYFIFTRLLIFFLTGSFVELDLIKLLIKKSTSNPAGVWQDTNNLLPLLDVLFKNANLLRLFSFAATIVLAIILYRRKSSAILIALPLLMPYIHLYDLTGILIVGLSRIYDGKKVNIFELMLYGIIFSPLHFYSVESMIVVLLLGILMYFEGVIFQVKSMNFLEMVLIVSLAALSILVSKITDKNLIPSATVSLVLAGLLASHLMRDRKNIVEGIFVATNN